MRALARNAERRAATALREAVRTLSNPPLSLSTRDAGTLLGISGQRVHKLLKETA